MDNPQAMAGQVPVSILKADARARFISLTYLHLLFAVLGFAGIEIFFFQSGLAVKIAEAMIGVSWFLVLGGFIVVGWLATRMAHTARSPVVQYVSLIGFVTAEAIIFVPLLYYAELVAPGPGQFREHVH